MNLSHACKFELPAWVEGWVDELSLQLDSSETAMAFVIELAKENVRRGSGGPFGAAVVDTETNELISVGVNLVTKSGLSITHAEMVAISLAQHRLGEWNLGRVHRLSLVTSCEPCAMCFGAVPWSGVRKLVCGAGKADAEAAGFDEGEKPGNWVETLRHRQIEVELGVLREEAAGIFSLYRESGGEIYNADPGQE